MKTDTAPTPRETNPASAAAILSTLIRESNGHPLASALTPLPAGNVPAVVAGSNPALAAIPTPREPGIYFGLSDDEYHADPSLGSTDLKRLLRSATDYWWGSWMNPKREPEATDTPAKKHGRALHKLVLEGRAAFQKGYIAEPQPSDWPKALRTADDLKRVLREKGEKLTGDKAELVKRVMAVAPEEIIWDEVMSTFLAAARRDRLEILKPEVFAEVETAGHMIAMNPHLANAFKGGASEVSVFWRDADGMPFKSRFDCLKPFTVSDLKKCANKGEHPFETACRLAFMAYRYDIQVQHYLEEGYAAFLELADAGRIFGDCPLPKGWLDQMAPAQAMTFTLVFHQTGGAPVTAGFEIASGSALLAQARADVAAAKARYRECMARFGTDLWVSEIPLGEFSLDELPYRYRVAAEMAEAA